MSSPTGVQPRPAEKIVVAMSGGVDNSSERLAVSDIHWADENEPDDPTLGQGQVRFRHAPEPAVIERFAANTARVKFERPVAAITPGQASVFCSRACVLGKGWIHAAG